MKYHKSKTTNKYKKAIDRLSKNNNIIKKDKGRGVVILDRTKYSDIVFVHGSSKTIFKIRL